MIPTREITVITGMRQVGKTTLCRMLFESIESDRRKLSLVAASLGFEESYVISREFVRGEGFIPASDL